jgi:phospholipid/cholesterol/gamma-HCH transport system substrate-binding protein
VRDAVSDLRHTLAATATHIDAIARNLETSSRDLSEFSGQLRRNPAVLLRGRGQGEEAAQ